MRPFIGLTLCLGAAGLAAQTPGPEGQHWIQAKAALVRPDTCDCIKNLAEYGLGVGTWLNPRWGYELDFMAGRLDSRHTQASADERQFQVALLFGLNPGGRTWFPYLRAGLGGVRVGSPYSLGPDATTRFGFHEGVGIQGFFGPNLMTSLEVRAITVDTQVARTEKQALLGVGLRWGEPADHAQRQGRVP